MRTFACVVLIVAACGGSNGFSDDSNGDAGPDPKPCTIDADCGPGQVCNDDGVCELGGCGGQVLDLTYVPPNFMIVLDRSCSMRRVLTGTMTSKWDAAVAALGNVLQGHADDIRWGLTLFPDATGNECTQNANALPIGDGNAAPINTLLQAGLDPADPVYPDGPCVTNIDTGILAAATDPALDDPMRKSYLMLVSDGAQAGCSAGGGDAGTEDAIAQLRTQRDIRTFVVGFGSGVDAAQLDRFAVRGGMPLAGSPRYYQADTANQLDQVFQQIADLAIGCEYTLDPPPSDPDQVYVYFGNTELVPRDPSHMAGWDYDAATQRLTLYGSYCQRVKTQAVTDVDVIFGCPVGPVE